VDEQEYVAAFLDESPVLPSRTKEEVARMICALRAELEAVDRAISLLERRDRHPVLVFPTHAKTLTAAPEW